MDDLRERIGSLVTKIFAYRFEKNRCTTLLVGKAALAFDFMWLRNKKVDMDKRKKRFIKVMDKDDIISWFDFFLSNLYITIGDSLFKQTIGIPHGY